MTFTWKGTEIDSIDSQALTVGESTMSRTITQFANGASAVSMGSGSMRGTVFTATKTETISQVRIWTSITAASAIPTLCRIGIYSVATNNDITLVASIANDTTLFASASTAYTRSLTASFQTIIGQRYGFCVLVVTAFTMPNFPGIFGSPELVESPLIGIRSDGQSDLPAFIDHSALGANVNGFYGVILP